jgi:hypothetical protein
LFVIGAFAGISIANRKFFTRHVRNNAHYVASVMAEQSSVAPTCNTSLYHPTNSPVDTRLYHPTDIPVDTGVYHPTDTPVDTSVYYPTDTPVDTTTAVDNGIYELANTLRYERINL